MPRPISDETIALLASALSEANASEVKGLSISELSERCNIPRSTVDRLVKRPEFGFREAAAKSNTGATTYYHDLMEMLVYSSEEEKIQPLLFDNEEKTKFVLGNLLNAVLAIDPTNKLVAAVGKEIAEKEADKGKPKTRSQSKDYLDWLLYPIESDLIQHVTENHKTAKERGEEWAKEIKDFGVSKFVKNTVNFSILSWWADGTDHFRPEVAQEDLPIKIFHSAARFLFLAAYIREGNKKKSD